MVGLSSRAHFQQSRACTYSCWDISLSSPGLMSVHSLPGPGQESQVLLPLVPPPQIPLCSREDQGPGKGLPHKVPWEEDGYSPPGTTCSTCQRKSGQSRRTAWEKRGQPVRETQRQSQKLLGELAAPEGGAGSPRGVQLETKGSGVREVAQQSRALTAFAEGSRSVPSTHILLFTATYNSTSRKSDASGF